jgi:hypothetical protein
MAAENLITTGGTGDTTAAAFPSLADDEDEDDRMASAHLMGATVRPDLLAKARALMEDDDELVLADEAGGVSVLGDTFRGASGSGSGGSGMGGGDVSMNFGAKKVPGGITPMGVRPDRGQGPLGGAGATTLAEMDGALSDLNVWNDGRRREEQRMRERLEGGAAGGGVGRGGGAGGGGGGGGVGGGGDEDGGFAAVGKITENVDAELAALDAELEEAMRVMRSGGIVSNPNANTAEGAGATTGAATGAATGATMAGAMAGAIGATGGMTMGAGGGGAVRGAVRRARPMSASARRGGRPLDVGPTIGTGVFGGACTG